MTYEADRALELLRAKLSGSAPVVTIFEPPGFHDFEHDQTVLAFDPSLLHTGYLMMNWPSACSLPVAGIHRTLNIGTQETGYRGTWDTAAQLQEELENIFVIQGHRTRFCGIEAPPVGNSALRRTESSLIAGTLIYAQARGSGTPVRHPSVNHISSVLLGNVSHDKKEIAAAVLRYFPDSGKRDWSEGQRDAAAVGLTVLYDLRREHDGEARPG